MSHDENRSDEDHDSPQLGEVFEFMQLLWSIDHALQRMSRSMATVIGITGPQRLVLRIVGRFPGIPAGQLARILRIDPSTLTPILQRLERDGLINRRADPHDGRRALIGLTPAGSLLDVESPGTVESAVRETLHAVDARDVAGARRLLESLAEALGRGADAEFPPLRLAQSTKEDGRRG